LWLSTNKKACAFGTGFFICYTLSGTTNTYVPIKQLSRVASSLD